MKINNRTVFGILSVTQGVTAATNKESQVTGVYVDARPEEEVMVQLVDDAERYRLEDVRQREFERAKESSNHAVVDPKSFHQRERRCENQEKSNQ